MKQADSIVLCEVLTLPSGQQVKMHRPLGRGLIKLIQTQDQEEIVTPLQQFDFSLEILTIVTDLTKEELLDMYDVDLTYMIEQMSRFLPDNKTEE